MTVTPDFWPDLRALGCFLALPLLVLGWYYARAMWDERHNDEEDRP